MLVARHLLALILGFAGATKRPRSDDSSDSEQDELSTFTTIQTVSPTTSIGAGPVTENASLYFLKRVVQSAGCLFSDAVACSGGFDDPMGHAAILLSSIFAKNHPECGPAKSPKADLGSVEQLRIELAKQIKSGQTFKGQISKAKADELQLIAARRLVDLALWANDEDLPKHSRSIKRTWEGKRAFTGPTLSAMDDLFAVADRTAALFGRSVFIWPLGRTSSDPLYPEEKLYAAAVVVMCRRLGVRPVSIFLSTSKFGNSLSQNRYNRGINWRRPGFQLIAVAVGKAVQELDPAESCKSLAEELGVSEPLDLVPYIGQYRHQPSNEHNLPMPPTPLAAPLPTELRGDFKEADRLLLIRSLQVAYMLLSQTAVDQRSLGDLLLQASTVMSHLLKLNGHDLAPYLSTHKPGMCFTALDLLRVVSEADRGPDLSAVSTVGDVMIAAAKTIFRHLYLTLPVTALIDADKFNVVELPEAHLKNMGTLVLYLCNQGAPHTLSGSSTLTSLYEATDAMLWAAFRIASWKHGSIEKTFVICTREMGEKIPIARQYTRYFLPRILWSMLGDGLKAVEAAALDLLVRISNGPKGLGDPQASRAVTRAPDAIAQVSGAVPRAPGGMYQAPGVIHQVPVIEVQVPVTTPQAATISSQVVVSDQAASSTDQMVSKVMTIMETMFPGCGMSIRHIREISVVILPHLHTNLTKAWELASSNRLMMTLQLQKLDDKLKRDRIPFSDADHVTVLLDALVALHLLQQGAVFQLASIPRTRMSDIGTEDKGNLTLLLVEALFKATSMQPAEGSISTALYELTIILVSAVEAIPGPVKEQ